MSLNSVWTQIKSETTAGANTANRVGQAGLDLVAQVENGFAVEATVSDKTAIIDFGIPSIGVESLDGKIVKVHNANGFEGVTSIQCSLKGVSNPKVYTVVYLDESGMHDVPLKNLTDYHLLFMGGTPNKVVALELSMSPSVTNVPVKTLSFSTNAANKAITISRNYDTYLVTNAAVGDIEITSSLSGDCMLFWLIIYTAPQSTEHACQVKWANFPSGSDLPEIYLAEGYTTILVGPKTFNGSTPVMGVLYQSTSQQMPAGISFVVSVSDEETLFRALKLIPQHFKGRFEIQLTQDITVRTQHFRRALSQMQCCEPSAVVAFTSTSTNHFMIVLDAYASEANPLCWSAPCTVSFERVTLIDYDNMNDPTITEEYANWSVFDFTIARNVQVREGRLCVKAVSQTSIELYNTSGNITKYPVGFIIKAPRVIVVGPGAHVFLAMTNEVLGDSAVVDRMIAYTDDISENHNQPAINMFWREAQGQIYISGTRQADVYGFFQGCMAIVTFEFDCSNYAEQVNQILLPSGFPLPAHDAVGAIFLDSRNVSAALNSFPSCRLTSSGQIQFSGIPSWGTLYVQFTYQIHDLQY